MKKIITALILLSTIGSLSGLEYQTRSIDVNATLGPAHSITVEAITGNQDGSSEYGTPFKLLNDDGTPASDVTQESGRRIAYWSLSTNYLPVNITVDAKDLALGENTIPYALRFAYEFPVYNNENVSYYADSFKIGSEGLIAKDSVNYTNSYTFPTQNELQGLEIAYSSPNSYIGFILPDSVIADWEENGYPPDGEYKATVVITMEGGV